MQKTDCIRILLVDDHAILRQGLRILLGQQPHLSIVGEADSGESTISAALVYQPDLILLDLLLPDMPSSELLPQLRRVSPKSRILILSGIEAAEPVFAAVDAGIDGYALKNMGTKDLVRAIEEVAAGNSYLHPSITRIVLFRASQSHSSSMQLTEDVEDDELPLLTKRQIQVLKLIASTATNREIADQLVVSEETIRTHVKHILRKLGASTRTQAVVEAVRMGIISV